MPAFTREELDAAVRHYNEVSARAGVTHNWDIFADLFTEDATYWEHLYGVRKGRETIRPWIKETMATYPGSEMPHFSCDWYVLDEQEGRAVLYLQNQMRDPGDGSVFSAPNVTILLYAGDNLWSYQEDVYNVDDFANMIGAWEARVRELGGEPGGSVAEAVAELTS